MMQAMYKYWGARPPLSKYGGHRPLIVTPMYNFILLCRLDHPNMVPLLGYSSDGIRLCLIYPYVALGSLDQHVPNPDLKSTQRILISQDVATALHYLHTACGEVLVHRDVKR